MKTNEKIFYPQKLQFSSVQFSATYWIQTLYYKVHVLMQSIRSNALEQTAHASHTVLIARRWLSLVTISIFWTKSFVHTRIVFIFMRLCFEWTPANELFSSFDSNQNCWRFLRKGLTVITDYRRRSLQFLCSTIRSQIRAIAQWTISIVGRGFFRKLFLRF